MDLVEAVSGQLKSVKLDAVPPVILSDCACNWEVMLSILRLGPQPLCNRGPSFALTFFEPLSQNAKIRDCG